MTFQGVAHLKISVALKKMFKCVSCGKTISTPFNLSQHIKIHSGENSFMFAKKLLVENEACGDVWRYILIVNNLQMSVMITVEYLWRRTIYLKTIWTPTCHQVRTYPWRLLRLTMARRCVYAIHVIRVFQPLSNYSILWRFTLKRSLTCGKCEMSFRRKSK